MQVSANIKLRAPTNRGPSQQKVLRRDSEHDHRFTGHVAGHLRTSRRSREHSVEHVILAVALLPLLTGGCPGEAENDTGAGLSLHSVDDLEDVDHITTSHLHEVHSLVHLLLLDFRIRFQIAAGHSQRLSCVGQTENAYIITLN